MSGPHGGGPSGGSSSVSTGQEEGYFVMRRCAVWISAIAVLIVSGLSAFAEARTRAVALELVNEGDHAGAAVEFRRAALESETAPAKGGYFWASAYEYRRAENLQTSDRMLDRAEDADTSLSGRALLLRGENAMDRKHWTESSFYFEGVLNGQEPDEAKTYAARKLAVSRLRLKDYAAAEAALAKSPAPEDAGLRAIAAYRDGRDRRPGVGGALGMIPGFGYFYAGEWANGFRSLILNSLFIFGMVNTAENEQWGAFAVITFFEFTWYSGSIYGGMDATQRFNRKRLDASVDEIVGEASFEPDYSALPSVTLRFEF